MGNKDYEVLRGTVDGKKKYCRIPIRSKTADIMQETGVAELSAEVILSMPRDKAEKTIDAIIRDWAYWVRRANELFVRWDASEAALKGVAVHARWIEDDETQTCSNCGEEHEWGDYRVSYCDTCGARMDAQEHPHG